MALQKNNSPHVLRVPTSAAILLTAVFCAIALLRIADFVSNRTYVVFNPDLRFGTGEASWFPARAAAFIRREQLPGNIFEDYELGGYAAWPGPEVSRLHRWARQQSRSFDGAVQPLQRRPRFPGMADRGRALESECSAGCDGQPSWLANMDAYKFCQSASWRPVYMDDARWCFCATHPAILR